MGTRHIVFAALIGVACLLPVGCGSGSGYAELTISAQNAQAVAMQGVGAVDMLSSMSDVSSGFAQTIEAGSRIVPCDPGNYTVTVVDAEPVGLVSAGDSATIMFNGCSIDVLGQSFSFNGGMSLTVNEATGVEGGQFSRELTVSFQTLRLSFGDASFTVNGGFTVAASSEDGETVVRAVSGTYFSVYAAAGAQMFSGTVEDFRLETSMNETSGVYTMTLAASVSSSGMGSMVTFSTATPFSGVDPADPSTGEMLVTGAGGTTLKLIAVDQVNVRLEVDTDGDGNPNVTINTTWTDLGSGDEA